jgi:hypothetical protein
MTRGAKHEYAASTLCAVIIGKRSPNITMMGLSTPVSDDGNTTWSGTDTRSPAMLLYQWTRKRLRASGASLSRPFNPAPVSAGIVEGSASWAKVGRTIFCSAKRFTLLASDAASTTLSARPSCVVSASCESAETGLADWAVFVLTFTFCQRTLPFPTHRELAFGHPPA